MLESRYPKEEPKPRRRGPEDCSSSEEETSQEAGTQTETKAKAEAGSQTESETSRAQGPPSETEEIASEGRAIEELLEDLGWKRNSTLVC